MHSFLQQRLAQARADELRRVAQRGAGRTAEAPELGIPESVPVTLRFAFPDDAEAIARLARLDSSVPPARPILLAEVGGQLLAALSLSTGAVLADPFHRTTGLIELLRARARQLTEVGSAPRPPLRSVRAAFRARLRLQPHR